MIAWFCGLTAQIFSMERRLLKLIERNEII